MQKIKLTKKVIIELFVIAGLFLVLLFFAVSQKVAIGQKYQQVYFNGELVGNVANHVSVDDAVHEVRRELWQQRVMNLSAWIMNILPAKPMIGLLL